MSDSLEFRLCRYIIAVAETSNFTRAAERLFLAQPSLSRQIRDLEADVGFAIFDRTRDGVRITPAGEMVLSYAREVLKSREELIVMAKAVHHGIVPPLRLGFSSFVNNHLLQSFRETYEGMFPGCSINLASGEAVSILARLDRNDLDCAVLRLPLDTDHYQVQQISQSPLVLCLRSDDSLAQLNQVDIHEVADRIRIFRDPELQPSAHTRLVEMFHEVGIPLDLACSAATPSDMQWMVKERYGLALIDQTTPLEQGLTTRPIAGVNWTVDTAFVCSSRADHIALPFIERTLSRNWRTHHRKKPVRSVRPEQLELLADAAIACEFQHLALANEVFRGKWSFGILCAMRRGPVRLGQLRRLMPDASKKVLLENLKRLEATGLVVRNDLSQKVLHVEYDLSESARQTTCQLIDCFVVWGEACIHLAKVSLVRQG